MHLNSSSIGVDVDPERGMSITGISQTDGPNILWERPVRAPGSPVMRSGPAGSGSVESLHEILSGGWFELSPNAGFPAEVDGVWTHHHGEAMRLPWVVTSRDDGHVAATASGDHLPVRMHRAVTLDGDSIRVSSEVENLGPRPLRYSHGEHPCFARPLFAGGRIELEAERAEVVPPLDIAAHSLQPGRFTWPLARARDGRPTDVSIIPTVADGSQDHYWVKLADSRIELVSPSGPTVKLQVDLSAHPYLLVWRACGITVESRRDIWDVIALEPMSTPGIGVPDALATGTLRTLRQGEVARFDTTLGIL